ncbi:hypothetical protein BH23GEM2_BH23GEM2_02800 [soil metagenome]
MIASILGRPVTLPRAVALRYPELESVRLRRGGLLPRIGGWALRRSTVDAITLRRTVYLAPHAALDPALLLHELRHMQQFFESRTFPLKYLWESVRRGYAENVYERDARRYAAQRLAATSAHTTSREA